MNLASFDLQGHGQGHHWIARKNPKSLVFCIYISTSIVRDILLYRDFWITLHIMHIKEGKISLRILDKLCRRDAIQSVTNSFLLPQVCIRCNMQKGISTNNNSKSNNDNKLKNIINYKNIMHNVRLRVLFTLTRLILLNYIFTRFSAQEKIN